MTKKYSINDIANELNISKTTVSFILNGRAKEKRIGEELVARVLKLVKEVNYRPNPMAKGLRTGKSNTIGLMVEDISNPFFANIARLIEDRAYEKGYRLLYCSTDNKTDKTRELIGMFRDKHVDGFIMAPPKDIEDDVQDIIKSGLPVVMFDRYLPQIDTDYVVVNNEFSTYNATRHLLQQGYKRIAFISFTSEQTQMVDRMNGYKLAMKEAKQKAFVKEVDFNRNENLIVEPLNAYLKKHQALEAIVFGTDHIGTCGLKVLKDLGLSIPNDVAVISFDDYDVFKLHTPPVSAIAQPIEAIAESVISLLLKKLEQKNSEQPMQKIILSTTLNLRESSAQLKEA
ncbi:substrate-binding domain-containing protein [Mucilaginibacter sp. JRF]|uniref:LacI family DNA-binding transcriptional regulator n=1 Tax=Mucilaginibacter sp. JRF TaxID=2780088 RepID=UPI001880A357|nr:substrate-binding domain-containing protein [Mucilaginibacter sp. JRF]MBE9585817.1 substrate-binding domain-containing protein [Mucilaginibacter sp. JRF]